MKTDFPIDFGDEVRNNHAKKGRGNCAKHRILMTTSLVVKEVNINSINSAIGVIALMLDITVRGEGFS